MTMVFYVYYDNVQLFTTIFVWMFVWQQEWLVLLVAEFFHKNLKKCLTVFYLLSIFLLFLVLGIFYLCFFLSRPKIVSHAAHLKACIDDVTSRQSADFFSYLTVKTMPNIPVWCKVNYPTPVVSFLKICIFLNFICKIRKLV